MALLLGNNRSMRATGCSDDGTERRWLYRGFAEDGIGHVLRNYGGKTGLILFGHKKTPRDFRREF
jgi:hypothetical protein